IFIFNLLDLKAENKKLKAHINNLNLELKNSQDLTKTLTIINEQFRIENNDLYRKLSVYDKIRMPRIMEERLNFKQPNRLGSCKHARYHINFINCLNYLIITVYLPMLGQMNMKTKLKKEF